MKQHIESLLQIALRHLQEKDEVPAIPAFIQIDIPKEKQFGDFATNIAMILAKPAQKKPFEIARHILSFMPASPYIKKIEIKEPGFINFFLSSQALHDVIKKVLDEKSSFGYCKLGRGKRILVEFLSAKPTGPLLISHGRHAVLGSVITNLLNAVGFKAYSEYYINDMGRQMDIVTVSLWLRYLSICGEKIHFPATAYQGDYIIAIARAIYELHGSHFHFPVKQIFANLPEETLKEQEYDYSIDCLIHRAKELLGDKYGVLLDLGIENILADMREDLSEFKVHYDNWFSEKHFVDTGLVNNLLEKFKKSPHVYERDGALWFRSTDFGDKRDRLLVRSDGKETYFTNDVAYHISKFDRGFDIAIDIFGSDHYGYISRMKGVLQSSDINPERLIHVLVQFVVLYQRGKKIEASTRTGNFVTLRQLRNEIGNDAARFFYLMRKSDKPLDFNLDLAKLQSNENPVYYIQYAYARIIGIFKHLHERHLTFNEENGLNHLDLLNEPQERKLMSTIARYPDMIITATLQYEPHLLTYYLRELANDLHAYYNAVTFLVDDEAVRNARLALLTATKQTFLNGFNLLGLSAPESV